MRYSLARFVVSVAIALSLYSLISNIYYLSQFPTRDGSYFKPMHFLFPMGILGIVLHVCRLLYEIVLIVFLNKTNTRKILIRKLIIVEFVLAFVELVTYLIWGIILINKTESTLSRMVVIMTVMVGIIIQTVLYLFIYVPLLLFWRELKNEEIFEQYNKKMSIEIVG